MKKPEFLQIMKWALCTTGEQYGNLSKKNRLLYDPAFPFLSIYTKGLEAGTQIDICTSMYIALFTIAKRLNEHNFPLMDKWINKMWSIYRILFGPKKEGNSETC